MKSYGNIDTEYYGIVCEKNPLRSIRINEGNYKEIWILNVKN